ncbi:hypothetical protein AB0C06_13875 [Micromonospora inaquosa]|uniref:hypothetical protein n=1 Tax=Micromonospora inaquosa TaxID=2203716 RepID=UPI003400553C
MPISKSLRWAAAFVAAGSLSIVAPVPASAALDGDLKLTVADVFVSKNVQSSGYDHNSPAPLQATVSATEPIDVDRTKTTFDTSGLAAMASASIDSSLSHKCKQEGAVITCTNTVYGVTIGLKALPNAPVGASGVVKVSVEIDGRPTLHDEATVTVAEDVRIYEANAPGTSGPVVTKPGEALTVRMRLQGYAREVHGVVVEFNNYDVEDDAIAVRRKYSNCTYDGDRLRTCTFRQRVDPVRGPYVDLPFKARDPIFRARTVSLEYRLWPLTEWAARQASAPVEVGTPGQDGVLSIFNGDNTVAPATDRDVPQVDINRLESMGRISILMNAELARHYLATIGDTVAGNPGDTVSVRFGMQNRSRFDYVESSDYWAPSVLVVLPVGVTVLEKPSECAKYVYTDPNDEPAWPGLDDESARPRGAGRAVDLTNDRDMLLCDVKTVIHACDRAMFAVKLRIDKASPIEGHVYGGWQSQMIFPLEAGLVVQDAGSASPVTPSPADSAVPCASPDPTTPAPSSSPDPATPAPSSSPDPATPAPSSSPDDSGGLPVTGGQVGVVAGVGAALAVLGVLLTLAARRRRIRLTV